ncbi:hypothetical protein FEM03_10735 [Phragmitibacter flavus]|uniref:3-keto-disaccharide hydrolase domain-containing protein n=2 Tax=Phragmitibacter flavus TaxID=2576071 RepID=A0A5R8KEU3_9BACT|nr:hypothetical protein FEM03_10735 [Phragmitibacter flavus]
MIKFAAFLLLFGIASVQAESKSFEFNFDDWPEGQPKEEAFVVDGKFSITAKDGNKALVAEVGELVEACVLLGDSARGSASIQAKVFSSRKGRSLPRYSIGVHGQSGYRLVVAPAQKQLQLTKSDEVVKSVPLEWPNEAWFHVKLEVKQLGEKQWTITAKAWADGVEEPTEGQMVHEDATLRGQGKCSLWATPYSGTPIYFDDVKIAISLE